MKRNIIEDVGTIHDGTSLDDAISELQKIKEEYPNGKIYLNFVENDDCACDDSGGYYNYLDIVIDREETNEEYANRLRHEEETRKRSEKFKEISKLRAFNELPDEIKNKLMSGINPEEIIKKIENEA